MSHLIKHDATKTYAQAMAESVNNPYTLYLTTDTHSIIKNGVEYGMGKKVSSITNDTLDIQASAGGRSRDNVLLLEYLPTSTTTATKLFGIDSAYNWGRLYLDEERIADAKTYQFSDTNTHTVAVVGNRALKSIPTGAFTDCMKLLSFSIPASVTVISSQAFSGCSGLLRIRVDKDNTVYDCRGDCNAVIKTATNELVVGCQSTSIPDTVISIDNYAFNGRTGLTSITLPSGLTSIGLSAFLKCTGLTTITIPSGVTSIGSYAFSGISNLEVHTTQEIWNANQSKFGTNPTWVQTY